VSDNPPVIYCANHPTVETTLRCNRCNKPICAKCAVLTPTGYRCKECVRGQQKIFETAQWYDFILVFFISLILSYVGSRIVTFIGFFTIFLAPVVGVVIAEACRLAVRKRRSNRLFLLAAVASVLGTLPVVLITVVGVLFSGRGFNNLLGLLWLGIYLFFVPSTVYYRMHGISIR
jgi:hypothetical protein